MQTKRLSDLIEYTRQTALLRTKPISDISKYDIFEMSELDILGLPGVHVDLSPKGEDEEGDDIWLKVDRLSETQAPASESLVLQAWLDVPKGVTKEPILLASVRAGLVFSEQELKSRELDAQVPCALESYGLKNDVEEQFKSYVANVWKPWADEERRRRKTISFYSKLFALKQQLDGDL